MNQATILTDEKTDDIVLLKYSAEKNRLIASDVGNAILGMNLCLREIANISSFQYEEICVLPLEKGSLKIKFIFVDLNWKAIVRIGIVADILVNSFLLSEKFGLSNLKSPSAQILEAVTDPRILDVCQSGNFRKGANKIVSPLAEDNKKLSIEVSNKSIEIKCEDKDKFLIDDEQILPQLVDGKEVEIKGELTRINKINNDLGINYKNHQLSVLPLKNQSAANFHNFLVAKEVTIKGIVRRNSYYENPRIIILSIEEVNNPQADIFEKN